MEFYHSLGTNPHFRENVKRKDRYKIGQAWKKFKERGSVGLKASVKIKGKGRINSECDRVLTHQRGQL